MTSTGEATTGLKVAVTGATGEIGRPFVRHLEKTPGVGSILAMVRRPIAPSEHGWTRTEFVQGDVTNPDDVAKLVDGADVVVHLAFLILGDRRSTRVTNLEGSRSVFEAAVAAGCRRIVYTSSAAAYGFHADHPSRLTEETPPAGTEHFYYSAQKVELEAALETAAEGTGTETFIFRPPSVGGPGAHAWLQILPYVQMAERLPASWPLNWLPQTARILPDFGVPLQLVHVEDVAAALCAGVVGAGRPGVYNLAAPRQLTMADIAHALGWRTVRLPRAVIGAAAGVQRRVPAAPALSDWVQALSARSSCRRKRPSVNSGGALHATPRRPCARQSPAPVRRGSRDSVERRPAGVGAGVSPDRLPKVSTDGLTQDRDSIRRLIEIPLTAPRRFFRFRCPAHGDVS